MKTLILLFTLLCCESIFSHPLLELSDEKECTKPGLMCETCTTSVMCVKMGGKWKKTGRTTCLDGSTCLNGTCSTEVNPGCDYTPIDFPCQYQGLYPHPGDWTKFIFCSPTTPDPTGPFLSTTVSCEEGTGYNAKTFYCNRNLTNIAEGTFPIERCLEQSQAPIPLPENPSIFYLCTPYGPQNKLYPIQNTCPSGGTYANGECTDNLV